MSVLACGQAEFEAGAAKAAICGWARASNRLAGIAAESLFKVMKLGECEKGATMAATCG